MRLLWSLEAATYFVIEFCIPAAQTECISTDTGEISPTIPSSSFWNMRDRNILKKKPINFVKKPAIVRITVPVMIGFLRYLTEKLRAVDIILIP